MAQTPASRLKKQFDSYDDMVEQMAQAITSETGSADYIADLVKTLYHEMEPIARSTYKHSRGEVKDGYIRPHKLVVDCVYLVCNAEGIKITVRGIAEYTDQLFNIKIRPEPYKWVYPHLDRICEMLKCGTGDLPVRGASGASMESSSGSNTSSQ